MSGFEYEQPNVSVEAALQQCFTYEYGAGLLRGVIGEESQVRLAQRAPSTPELLQIRAPELADIFSSLAAAAKDALTYGAKETLDPSDSHISHTDNNVSKGISVLIPLTGPDAEFFASEAPFTAHKDTAPENRGPQIRAWQYGVGDVMLVRQEVDTPTGSLPQIHHVGLAIASRELMTVTLVTPTWEF